MWGRSTDTKPLPICGTSDVPWVRTRVTESHFSRYVRLSFGFRRRSSHFPHQTARPGLNVKPHGAETAHLIAVAVVEEEVHPGVHGCNDRPDGTAAANILSAKDWAWCLGCRALNSSWECQTVWSSRAPSSISCQRAGKTCGRLLARPSKIGGNYAQAIRVVNSGLDSAGAVCGLRGRPGGAGRPPGRRRGRNRWS